MRVFLMYFINVQQDFYISNFQVTHKREEKRKTDYELTKANFYFTGL